jgi:hypothetical protein
MEFGLLYLQSTESLYRYDKFMTILQFKEIHRLLATYASWAIGRYLEIVYYWLLSVRI